MTERGERYRRILFRTGIGGLLVALAGELPLRAITTVEWPRRKLDQIVSLSKRTDRRLILLRVGGGPGADAGTIGPRSVRDQAGEGHARPIP